MKPTPPVTKMCVPVSDILACLPAEWLVWWFNSWCKTCTRGMWQSTYSYIHVTDRGASTECPAIRTQRNQAARMHACVPCIRLRHSAKLARKASRRDMALPLHYFLTGTRYLLPIVSINFTQTPSGIVCLPCAPTCGDLAQARAPDLISRTDCRSAEPLGPKAFRRHPAEDQNV